MQAEQHRRCFLKSSMAAATALALVPTEAEPGQKPDQGTTGTAGPIPRRTLGRTGQQVTICGLGGLFTVARHDRHEQAVEIVNRAIDLGINYIDTAPRYGNGASELNIGTVMKKRRAEVFLACKSHDYTYDGTMALVEQSLKRLETDRLDLYQHHFLGKLGTLEQLRQKNSARQAFERLRDQGVIRYIGVTSHSAKLLADALEDYPYDCALITLNAARAVMDDVDHLDRFFRLAREKNVGVIAMKVFARGELVTQGYSAEKLLRFVWSYPIATAVVGITEIPHLEENVRIARASGQLTREHRTGARTVAAR